MPVETLEFEDGGVYTGEVVDGMPHGKGKFMWENGDEYDGEWVENIQQGHGKFKWANGDIYEGQWENDQAHGKGKMLFKNGNVYEGDWANDKMDGKGTLRFKDGRVYEGDFKNDKKHGRGKETSPNGEYYDGQWVDGKKEGKGFYVWPNGDRYDGDYKNDLKEGKGVFRWANGDSYEGEVKNGVKHGKGIHRYANGNYYAGNFVNGKEDGKQKLHKVSSSSTSTIGPDSSLSLGVSMIDLGSSQRAGGNAPGKNQSEIAPPLDMPSKSKFDFSNESVEDVDLSGWKRGNVLGKGSFGEVFLGLLKNGKFVAVKTIELGNNSDDGELDNFRQELNVMRELKHRNIVRYLGSEYNKTDNILNIFIEYAPQGSVAAVTKKFNTLPVPTVRMYTKQILEGLQYLHEHQIIHRDIKGDNILLDSDGTAKLADFGCSRKLDEICSKTHGCNTMVGTPYWMAPEVITNDKGYGYGADIWSTACTVVEMLTAKPPWPEFASMWAAIYHIANSSGSPSGIPENLEPDLRKFLDLCFIREPSKRPSAKELLKLPFFSAWKE